MQCTLARTSTGTHIRPKTSTLLRLLTDEVPPETPDPMGLAELIFSTTLSFGEAKTRITLVSPEGA
jgi:hypothetical protein